MEKIKVKLIMVSLFFLTVTTFCSEFTYEIEKLKTLLNQNTMAAFMRQLNNDVQFENLYGDVSKFVKIIEQTFDNDFTKYGIQFNQENNTFTMKQSSSHADNGTSMNSSLNSVSLSEKDFSNNGFSTPTYNPINSGQSSSSFEGKNPQKRKSGSLATTSEQLSPVLPVENQSKGSGPSTGSGNNNFDSDRSDYWLYGHSVQPKSSTNHGSTGTTDLDTLYDGR